MPVHIGTMDLYDDEQVLDTIRRAEDGNDSAAWFLIHQIETVLIERRISGPLLDYAAAFFRELLNIYEQDREGPSDLVEALHKLHLIRRRGQPRQNEDEKNALVACVLLLADAGYSVDVALNALDGFRGSAKGSYQAAYYGERGEPGGSLKRLAETADLEAMAGIPRADLIDELKKSGALQ